MRTARQPSASDVYHVVGRGAGCQIVFEDDEDRNAFLEIAKKALGETGTDLYAWCLMDNHYHALVRAPLDQLSRFVRVLAGSYALRFNIRHGRTGPLFQGRFKSEPVNDDAYFMTVMRYIHRNPEKAGICEFDRYRWSSYGEYAGRPHLCDTTFALGLFDGIDSFEAFHRDVGSVECIDVEGLRSSTRAMPDAKAVEKAEETLRAVGAGIGVVHVKGLARRERTAVLAALKQAGLSVRQIERLTGVNRGAIQRAEIVSNYPSL